MLLFRCFFIYAPKGLKRNVFNKCVHVVEMNIDNKDFMVVVLVKSFFLFFFKIK